MLEQMKMRLFHLFERATEKHSFDRYKEYLKGAMRICNEALRTDNNLWLSVLEYSYLLEDRLFDEYSDIWTDNAKHNKPNWAMYSITRYLKG